MVPAHTFLSRNDGPDPQEGRGHLPCQDHRHELAVGTREGGLTKRNNLFFGWVGRLSKRNGIEKRIFNN